LNAAEVIQCKFLESISSDYENVNDFSFQDYPWLTIKQVSGGWEVTVGGIIYGDQYSETAPEQIRKESHGTGQTVFESANVDEPWQIRIDTAQKTALFSVDIDGGSSGLKETALFKCQ
jgi:hypothetical protein